MDADTAGQGCRLLSTAIGMIMEDELPESLRPVTSTDWPRRAAAPTRRRCRRARLSHKRSAPTGAQREPIVRGEVRTAALATTPEQDRVEAEVMRLEGLDLAGLRDAWPKRFGPTPKLRSRELLARLLAWRLQVEAFGGLDAETRRLLARPLKKPKGPVLPLGTRLLREWQGERHEAEIVEGRVRYRGKLYASLSEVARAVTGVRWNGPRFFGLRGSS